MLAHEIHDKRFVALENPHGRSGAGTTFSYLVEGDAIHGSYSGGQIRIGQLVGRIVADERIEVLFQCITGAGGLLSGRSTGTVWRDSGERLRLDFEWVWLWGRGEAALPTM